MPSTSPASADQLVGGVRARRRRAGRARVRRRASGSRPPSGSATGDEDAGHGAASVDRVSPRLPVATQMSGMYGTATPMAAGSGGREPMRWAEPITARSTRSTCARSSSSIAPTSSATPRSLCRSDADAEDLAQTAVVRALASGAEVRNPERAKWYVLRIVRNLATDQARARARVAVEPWAEVPDAVADPACPTRASCTTTSTSSRAPRSPSCHARPPGGAAAPVRRGARPRRHRRSPPHHRAGGAPARLPRHAGAARHHAAAPAARPVRPRQPLDAFRRRNCVTCTQLRRQNEVLGEISRPGVRAHPSPPRGGEGGRGHGPRSDGRAPG